MNTTIYHAGHTSSAPTPYLESVARAARSLFKALFPARNTSADSLMSDRIAVLRLADSYRCTAPSLSRELTAIAYRDS